MASASIHTGIWTDYSRGRIDGLTLTLSEKHSGYLQSFLAILVTFAGSQLWSIFAFILHIWGAGKPFNKHELIHQQRQVILRNSNNAGHTISDLVYLMWAWRKHKVRIVHCLGPILVAVAILVAFSIAGIFTGEITKSAGSHMLVQSNFCGLWGTAGIEQKTTALFTQKRVNDSMNAANYVANCYGSTTKCNNYVKQTLPYTIQYNVSCPFDDDFCTGGATGAVSFDTGKLDSQLDFGINAPPGHRVQFRRYAVCSPLVFGEYCQVENVTVPSLDINDQFIRCYTGPTLTTNYTFGLDKHSYWIGTAGYQLTAFIAFAGSSDNSWQPISELNRTDSDVSILYLAQNSVVYENPVDDSFFSAHLEKNEVYTSLNGTKSNYTLYIFDSWIDGLGCTDQYQICNPLLPDSEACTPLTGVDLSIAVMEAGMLKSDLAMNHYQVNTAARVLAAGGNWPISSMAQARGASALKANEIVNSYLESPGLPDNQWVIETSTWFAQTLAATQSTVLQYVTGPGTDEGEITYPEGEYQTVWCKNQLVDNDSGYQNFSVLGIGVVVALCGLIILLSYTIRPLAGFLYRTPFGKWHHQIWTMEKNLQLQRLAYQGGGYRQGWHNTTFTDTPLFEKGVLFEDITALDHRTASVSFGYMGGHSSQAGGFQGEEKQEKGMSESEALVGGGDMGRA